MLLIILFSFSMLIFILIIIKDENKKKLISESRISILYGYPANGKVWLTIYHQRLDDTWEFEYDDLFDAGRPKNMYPIQLDLMYKDNKSGATESEFITARKLLNSR